MSRNLLPRLRTTPTPANIPEGTVGAWSAIQSPEELAKIEYKDPTGQELRTRIHSIPSPWARMLLFRAALEDPGHPARDLVENEILDALEFMWSLNRLPGIALDFRRIDLSRLSELGERTGSRRAQDVADALVDLIPRVGFRGGHAEVTSLTLGLVHGRPVLASSPYPILFTAEDAAQQAGVAQFFKFAAGGPRRRLVERPLPFQEYVAQVVAPQLYAPLAPAGDMDSGWLQSLVRPWLEEEIRRCVAAAQNDETRRRVSLPTGRAEWDWRGAAERLGLEPVNTEAFAGIAFYRQRLGAELAHSPFRLRSTRPVEQAPLVITADRFRGYYYHGAQHVALPPEFRSLERTRLPGLGIQYPWVSPADDWLTDRVVLLSEPIEREHVYGYANYRWRGTAPDARFSEPHMLLPLRSGFFRFFSPEDVDHMLTIDVHPDGRIEVTLAVPIGMDEDRILIHRVYRDADILNEHGPAFSLWPSFQEEIWSPYVLFRHDTTQAVAQQFALHALADGRPLPQSGRERRTPLVEATVFDQAPEVLELRSTLRAPGSRAESAGVILPRYRVPAARNQDSWDVGVDFGTSNTVVSVRGAQHPVARIFGAADMVLPLTEASESTRHLIDAYFFPEELPSTPFGTAVVYHDSLQSRQLDREPLGLRVNVPYAGDVDGYKSNRVQGDLKWSADAHAHFLSAAFLRHVVATVIAEAIRTGVDPARLTFRWAYPRAFSQSQLNKLRQHWNEVLHSFSELGVRDDALREELDESRSVLQHFFNANLVQPAGDIKAIVDIGGGTSDIALYGRGRVLGLDSVVLGGRNLTGPRLQGGAGQTEGNPFVDAFFAWAREHGLPDGNRNAVRTYLDRDQVHLAFSYLVGTRWFRENQANLFTGHSAFHNFQALVLYFFGALFYYLGLSLRSLASPDGDVELPVSVLVAGNGSRYLDWLTDLVPDRAEDNVFKRALGHLLAEGAGIRSPTRIPSIHRSNQPKQEVALGLVARVSPGDLPDAGALTTPVVGEAVTLRLGNEGEMRTFSPAERFDSRNVIEVEHVRDLRWETDMRQIECFHDSLVRCSEMVTLYGDHWTRVPQRYRAFFASFGRSEVQNRTEGRLQFLAQLEQGFRGSLFLLEAAVVLEEMRDRFFAP